MSVSSEQIIRVPTELVEFVADRVASGQFADISQYVSSLIEADRRRSQIRAELEQLALEGLDSGPLIEVDDAFWEERRLRLQQSLDSSEAT